MAVVGKIEFSGESDEKRCDRTVNWVYFNRSGYSPLLGILTDRDESWRHDGIMMTKVVFHVK